MGKVSKKYIQDIIKEVLLEKVKGVYESYKDDEIIYSYIKRIQAIQ